MLKVASPPRRSPIGWIVVALMTGLALALIFFGPVFAISARAATVCMASWYAYGTRTANGERFYPDGLTAAHLSYPFGTRLRVTWHSHSVVVRVNDRGPARWTGKCLDLSRGAARSLGMLPSGVARVSIEVVR